jgi:hypothetical protein
MKIFVRQQIGIGLYLKHQIDEVSNIELKKLSKMLGVP